MTRLLAFVAVIVLMVLVVIPDTGAAGPGMVAATMQEVSKTGLAHKVQKFLALVDESGYERQQGQIQTPDLNQAFCTGNLWTSLGPNIDAPYFVSILPPVPGQAPPTAAPIVSRLREDEALVLIGTTPPRVGYFAITVNMIRGRLAPPQAPVLFVPTADPINNLLIRTTAPTAFNAPFVVVATGHKKTQGEVHRMLQAAGLGAVINDQVIPPALFRLGLDANGDEFGLAMRTAVVPPESEQAFAQYAETPPIQVFRVRPKGATPADPVYAPDPLPVPPLRVPGSGDASENDLNPTLQTLRQAIIDQYPGYTATDVRVDPWAEYGYPGLQRNMVTDLPSQDGVFGATNDARYLGSSYLTVPDGSFLVAYGPDHRATVKATYASVSVYADPVAWVSLAGIQSTKLQGSARDFIPGQPNADQFYAWTFTRTNAISGSHVTTLPPTATQYCEQYGTTTPVDMQTLRIFFRLYAEPATQVRPAESELLLDRLLLFTPR